MIRQTLFKGNTTMGLYRRGVRLGSTPDTPGASGDLQPRNGVVRWKITKKKLQGKGDSA